jgi:osmoprotectant transport system substrate-binding protein
MVALLAHPAEGILNTAGSTSARLVNTAGSTSARLVAVLVVIALGAPGCRQAGAPIQRELPPPRAIAIGSFDFPESGILARLYGGALERAGYRVSYVLGIGPRELVQPALRQGLIGVVPEYTGSALDYLDGIPTASADATTTARRLDRAAASVGLRSLRPSSAADHNAVAVTAATARDHELRDISDLAPAASELAVGGPSECPSRPLCLAGLEARYGLHFGRFIAYPDNAVTGTGLRSGAIDVGILFSTDGVIAQDDLVVLRDDLGLQPSEQVVPIVRDDLVSRYGDDLVHTFDRVSAGLTTSDLRELNRQVGILGRSPEEVAGEWLSREGFGVGAPR